MKIVFATGNPNKLREVKQLLEPNFTIVSLKEIGCVEDIPETQPTIEGNAIQKAVYVKEHYGLDCFAEDTGLEIDALGGEPGVYSARYAGPEKNAQANIKLVLQKLNGEKNRKARFKTVVALILDNNTHTFEGIVEGKIASHPSGDKGFGYDPIFFPEDSDLTFAQMSAEAKNQISHRAKAIEKLTRFLNAKF